MRKIRSLFLNDFFILAIIFCNALLIFIQEFELRSAWTNIIESIFTLLFVAELTIKITEYGFKKYLSSGWNRLDFILILVSIPSLASLFVNDGILAMNFFLSFRVLRIFKFFRLIRFFPNIDQLISGINRAFKASYIVLIGFFSLVFIFSIVSCSLFKGLAPEYFNNPLNSFYSIFRLFSVEGWYEIPDLIAERSTPFIAFMAKIYFMLILLGGGILGLSLVNSIFVDAMVSDNNDELILKIESLTEKVDKLLKDNDNKQVKPN